jgi:nuclease S1
LPHAICCPTFLAPARCAAWGGGGHRIIARIAARRLSDSAKKGVAKTLGVKPDDAAIAEAMAQVSTYADEIRPLRPDAARWHFVDMPGSAGT